jgi:hypothetical protein
VLAKHSSGIYFLSSPKRWRMLQPSRPRRCTRC